MRTLANLLIIIYREEINMSELIKDPVVLFEDNHLIVVVKPANMLVQGDQTGDGDLLTWLKEYVKEKYISPEKPI